MSATIKIEVECYKCGADLNATWEEGYQGGKLRIEPCEDCIKRAESDSYDKGFEKGEESAKSEQEDAKPEPQF